MQEELLNTLKSEFEKAKQELKFKSNFEELDSIFFLKDWVLQLKYVSPMFSRALCHRIIETFYNWNGYLHSLIMPNPQNMINLTESNLVNEEEKKEIIQIMNKIMLFASTNSLIGLSKDNKAEVKFIDDSVHFWKKSLNPHLQKIMRKMQDYWKEKSK